VNMDKKTILVIVLSILFYMAYNHYLQTKYPNMGMPVETQQSEQVPSGQKSEFPDSQTSSEKTSETTMENQPQTAPGEPVEEIRKLTSSELIFENDTSIYRFSQKSGSIESIQLKNFRQTNVEDSPRVDLVDHSLFIQGTTNPTQTSPHTSGFHGSRSDSTIRFWRNEGPWRISQEFIIAKDGYGVDLNVTFTNVSPKAQDLTAGVLFRENMKYAKVEGSSFLPGVAAARPSLIYSLSGDTDWEDAETYCTDNPTTPAASGTNQNVSFLGFDSHYFMKVFLPKDNKLSFKMQKVGVASEESCPLAITTNQAYGLVASGENIVISYRSFFGPKDLEKMESFDETLTTTIDLGIFDFIAKPLLIVIKSFYGLMGNYGWAIVLLTVLLKILFYPLMKASATSMYNMKKLNPEMQALREKYKDDKQKQQQELMKFMSANKINPAKGCLPILPQIPVFFAFYQVLRTAIELRHAPFFGWIQDLSAMDPYYVTPVLMGVGMFFQQKLTPTTGMDKTQEKIMMALPLVFTVMMLTLPSGMVVYMLTNIIMSIVQQQYLNRKLDRMNANKKEK
jgi:YidC/Oxa1 family membrane protein insertase